MRFSLNLRVLLICPLIWQITHSIRWQTVASHSLLCMCARWIWSWISSNENDFRSVQRWKWNSLFLSLYMMANKWKCKQLWNQNSEWNGNNMWALILSLSRWEISRSMSNGCHTFRSIHIIVYSLNPCESYSTFSLSRNNFYHAIASKEKQASARRMQFCSTQWARMFAPRARLQLNEIIRVLLFSKSNVIKRFNVLPCQVSNRTIFAVLLLSISN